MARASAFVAQAGREIPAGTINAFPGPTPSLGWLPCNGTTVEIVAYPTLYAVIGTTYNTGGEPVGHFRLPNTKGVFLRGLDGGRGIDTGRVLGSTQAQQRSQHNHPGGTLGVSVVPTAAPHTHPATVGPNAAPHTHTFRGAGGLASGPAQPGAVDAWAAHVSPIDASLDHGNSSSSSHTHTAVVIPSAGPTTAHTHTFSAPTSLGAEGGPTSPLAPTHPAPFRGQVRPRNVALTYLIKT